jgi:hypothetical protein
VHKNAASLAQIRIIASCSSTASASIQTPYTSSIMSEYYDPADDLDGVGSLVHQNSLGSSGIKNDANRQRVHPREIMFTTMMEM